MSQKSGGAPPRDGSREARLAEALRENLRRRKQQLRGREAVEPAEPAGNGRKNRGLKPKGETQ